MIRSLLAAAVLAAALLLPAAAMAQFGAIFGEPPRPPGSVPGRGPADSSWPPPEPLPPPPQERGRPGPAPQQGTVAAPAGVQSQPLPPPPGSSSAPPDSRPQWQAAPQPQPGQPPLVGLPPGQRQPRGAPQPANAALQPGDEVVEALPAQKIANSKAVFSGLDKITGRTIAFDVAVNETVQFGALQVTPRVCYTRPPTETQNTDAFIEVDEITLQGEVRRLFTGWMFASSPGLHAVEHPIYDIWLVDCKSDKPAVAESQPQPPPQRAEPPPKPPQQRPPAQRATRSAPPPPPRR